MIVSMADDASLPDRGRARMALNPDDEELDGCEYGANEDADEIPILSELDPEEQQRIETSFRISRNLYRESESTYSLKRIINGEGLIRACSFRNTMRGSFGSVGDRIETRAEDLDSIMLGGDATFSKDHMASSAALMQPACALPHAGLGMIAMASAMNSETDPENAQATGPYAVRKDPSSFRGFRASLRRVSDREKVKDDSFHYNCQSHVASGSNGDEGGDELDPGNYTNTVGRCEQSHKCAYSVNANRDERLCPSRPETPGLSIRHVRPHLLSAAIYQR